MEKVQASFDIRELHKIVNGLILLRQTLVECQHKIVIDHTNLTNKAITKDVKKIDCLIEKMMGLTDQTDPFFRRQ